MNVVGVTMNVSSKNAKSRSPRVTRSLAASKRAMSAQGMQQKYHGIALLAGLTSRDAVHLTIVHLAQVLGTSAAEHAREGECCT